MGSAIYIQDVEPTQKAVLHFDSKSESELLTAVKFGGQEEIGQAVKAIALKMDEAKVHVRQYQTYLIGIMNCLTRIIQQYELLPAEVFGKEADYFGILSGLNTTENVQQWLFGVCVRMSEQLSRKRNTTTQNIIQQAKEDILENYGDPDLSVE